MRKSWLFGKTIRKENIYCNLMLLRQILFLAFVAILIWISRFLMVHQFGLYEDDQHFLGHIIDMNSEEFSERFLSYLYSGFISQGRPVGFAFSYVTFWIGYNFLGGLKGVYFLGYLCVAANAILFYLLAKRLFPLRYAEVATLAFALFPADTTQALLTHALILQPAITFILIAAHFYMFRKWVLAYSFLLLSLLSYEPGFPVFLLAPFLLFNFQNFLLLKKTILIWPLQKNSGLNQSRFQADIFQSLWRSAFSRYFFVNLITMFLLFAFVFLARRLSGETRVSDLNFGTVSENIVFGPLVAISRYFSSAISGLENLDVILAFDHRPTIVGCIVLTTFTFFLFSLVIRKDIYSGSRWVKDTFLELTLTTKVIRIPRFVLLLLAIFTGYIAMVLSYTLTFSTSVFTEGGRGTRAHTYAVFGAAILIAALFYCLFSIPNFAKFRFTRKAFVNFSAALYFFLFSLLVPYGFIIQKSYVDSWAYQKSFWSEVIPLIPDVTNDSNVLIDLFLDDGTSLYPFETDFIEVLSWPSYNMLNFMFEFPSSWSHPPRVWILGHLSETPSDLKTFMDSFRYGNRLIWPTPSWFWEFEKVDTALENTLLIRATEKGLVRVDNFEDTNFKALPSELSAPAFHTKHFYDLYINS